MSAITTHVLDTARGRPAANLKVELHLRAGENWRSVGMGVTDENGRCTTLLGGTPLVVGTYRLTFYTATYFRGLHIETFFADIPVVFEVKDARTHYHVPLLLSPFGYSTYRGS